MKIVQYMLGFRNADGGVVRAVIDLCNALAQRGHQVIALTTDASDAPRNWDGKANRPELRMLAVSRLAPMLASRAALSLARDAFGDAHIIHLHVPWDPVCAQLARLARSMSIPYVLTPHGMLDDWTMNEKSAKKRLYLGLAGKRLLERAAFVHCSAHVEAQQSAKWYPRGRSSVVPLPFDLEPYRNLPGEQAARREFPQLSQRDPVVLYLGRLHPIKRIEMLLDAVAQVVDTGTPLQLVVAGTGDADYERMLRQRAASSKLAQRIVFTGFISGQRKLSIYQAADFFVLPSAHESFGYAALEALACGTPAIVTRAVNIWSELESSGGVLVTGESAESLAAGLRQLAADGASRQRMGELGRAWTFHYFDPQRGIELYERMYRDAAS